MSYDVSLALDESGKKLVAHRIDCPDVRHQADVLEESVITLLGCERPLPADIERHSCMDDDAAAA